jgi:predicted nucleic acid-binding protein
LWRQIATFYNLKHTGTLGVLIKAKQSGYLPAIAPVISALQSRGMWLSEAIIQKALHLAGEFT